MKTIIYTLILGLALSGCADLINEPSATMSEGQDYSVIANEANDATTVTNSDIRNIVSIFGNGSSEKSSRSQSSEDYTVSTIFDSEGNPAIYVINYADDGGFVLVSATKNYHPILAYSDEGNYNVMRPFPSGLDYWENITVNAIKETPDLSEEEKAVHNVEWIKYSAKSTTPIQRGPGAHEYITDEEYNELTQIYLQETNELIANGKKVYPYETNSWISVLGGVSLYYAENIACNVYWMYEDIWQDFAAIVFWEESSETVTPETVKAKWSQEEAYSKEYQKRRPNGLLPYAGCGPIAAGQIMHYFQHPSKYNWQDMPLLYATSTTSKFLYDVAESANAVYGNDGTTTYISDIRNTFVEFGYNADAVKAANSKEMTNSLKSGSPIYLRGNEEGAYNAPGHAWIATRVKIKSQKICYDIYNFGAYRTYKKVGSAKESNVTLNYFYYNWGGIGYPDGYYLLGDYHYNVNMQVILNIKPK